MLETTAPTTRRELSKAERRSRIVEAAASLLRESGIDSVSMLQIAERAGVSPATVYNLFQTKAAVFQQVFDRDLSEYERLVEAAPAGDALDRIFKAIDIAATLYRRDRGFLPRHGAGSSRLGAVSGHRRAPDRILARMVAAARAKGRLGPEADAHILGVTLTQILRGAFSEWAGGVISAERLAAEASYGFALALRAYAAGDVAADLTKRLRRSRRRSLNTIETEATDDAHAGARHDHDARGGYRRGRRPKAHADPPRLNAAFAWLRAERARGAGRVAGFRPVPHRHQARRHPRGQPRQQPLPLRRLPLDAGAAPAVSAAAEAKAAGRPLLYTLVQMDEPDHMKYRALTQAWFMPQNIRKLEDRIRELAREAGWRGCSGRRRMRLRERGRPALSRCRVIMEILGVPREDEPRMLKLTQELFGATDPDLRRKSEGTTPEARRAEIRRRMMDFFNYFNALTEIAGAIRATTWPAPSPMPRSTGSRSPPSTRSPTT